MEAVLMLWQYAVSFVILSVAKYQYPVLDSSCYSTNVCSANNIL